MITLLTLPVSKVLDARKNAKYISGLRLDLYYERLCGVSDFLTGKVVTLHTLPVRKVLDARENAKYIWGLM